MQNLHKKMDFFVQKSPFFHKKRFSLCKNWPFFHKKIHFFVEILCKFCIKNIGFLCKFLCNFYANFPQNLHKNFSSYRHITFGKKFFDKKGSRKHDN